MNTDADLLTIQKFIYLLDDFHYEEFRQYLTTINAAMPLKLVEKIRKQLPLFDSPEQLCKKIYFKIGKSERQSFNQLSSHTFRLSSNLANNYPEYLVPNIQKTESLVASQKLEEANFLNKQLLDIAERINHFRCQLYALNFLSLQAHLIKDANLTKSYDNRLQQASDDQFLFYKLLSEFRSAVDNAAAPKTEKEITELRLHFEQFNDHRCPVIQILSQYICLRIISELTITKLTDQDTERVEKIRKAIANQPYLVFPFLMDLKGNVEHMILNSSFPDFFAKETQKDIKQLSLHYESLNFWKNYFNRGEINLMLIQATGLLSKYHHQIHLSDYQNILERTDKVILHDILERGLKIRAQLSELNNRPFDEITVRMLCGAALILSGGPKIAEGIAELEALLTNYQQVNFKRSTSSIFMVLMLGYFSSADYEKCNQTFKRYLKSIKGKLFFEGNHVKIQAYYYLSQWLATGSKQYPAKLRHLLEKDEYDDYQTSIWALVSYFNLPIPVPVKITPDMKFS